MRRIALIKEHGPGRSHWHLNDCHCCVTLHVPDGSYVIGPDGAADYFPGRHCDCANGVSGQTR
jgi:hypothetical protein